MNRRLPRSSASERPRLEGINDAAEAQVCRPDPKHAREQRRLYAVPDPECAPAGHVDGHGQSERTQVANCVDKCSTSSHHRPRPQPVKLGPAGHGEKQLIAVGMQPQRGAGRTVHAKIAANIDRQARVRIRHRHARES
jgi:hypothetical protein